MVRAIKCAIDGNECIVALTNVTVQLSKCRKILEKQQVNEYALESRRYVSTEVSDMSGISPQI